MPFAPPFPRAFTASSIREFAPAQSGVYGISNAREWIYVGESDDIQAALLAHVGDNLTDIARRQPKGFVFETCDRAGRQERQERLVAEYSPVCNQTGRPRR